MEFRSGYLCGNPKEGGCLAFLDADMRKMPKLISQEQYGRRLIRLIWMAIGKHFLLTHTLTNIHFS